MMTEISAAAGIAFVTAAVVAGCIGSVGAERVENESVSIHERNSELDPPRFVVLETTPVYSVIDGQPPVEFTLQRGTVGYLLAESTFRIPQGDTAMGYRFFLVESEYGRGWVGGEDVAIEPRSADDRRNKWPGRSPEWHDDAFTLWSAVREGREWSDKWHWEYRTRIDGYWIIERDDEAEVIDMAYTDDHARDRTIDRVVWHDVTGDGQPDPIVVFAESASEVGHVGRTIVFYDIGGDELSVLWEIEVDDPHWNGLELNDTFARVEVMLHEQQIDKTAAWLESCEDDDSTALSCLFRIRQSWVWSDGEITPRSPLRERWRVTLKEGPLYRQPPSNVDSPVEDYSEEFDDVPMDEPLCVWRVKGRVGVGVPFWVEVGSCTEGETRRWVRSTQLNFDDPLMEELSGEWPEDPGPYILFRSSCSG